MTPIGGAGLIIDASSIDAPILALLSPSGTNPPQFTIIFDITVVAGDDVVFAYSQDPQFAGASTLTNTLDAAEILAGEITEMTGVLAAGTWYFRARIESGSDVSPWSNTVTDTFAASDNELDFSTAGNSQYIMMGWV